MSVIFGYSVANDVTARLAEKGWSVGAPRVSTPSARSAVGRYELRPRRRAAALSGQSGEVRQDSTTALMVYSIARIIAHVCAFATLEPGDLLS